MLSIALSSASKALEKEVRGHASKMRKASVRALNKTATQNRNQASVIVRNTINIKSSAVKRLMKITRAKSANLVAKVQAKYQAVPLINYLGVRQTRKGVTVKTRKDKPRLLIRGAFKQRIPGGKLGVFIRKGGARLPIKEVRGPTIAGIFAEKVPQIVKLGDPLLVRVFDSEVKFEFSKKNKK